jgi:D-alanine-D-alanine ligase
MPSGETLSTGPIRMLVIAGGPSAEHEVSIKSAQNVLEAVTKSTKLRTSLLVLTRQGRWLSESESQKALAAGGADHGGTVMPTVPLPEFCDVVFPLLDGWEGGAGAVQGILEMEGIPYLGGGIMATVLTRDKIVAKQVLAAHGIPMVRHVAFTREDYVESSDKIIQQASAFNLPLFVKPANLGSALGVSMVKDLSALDEAMQTAMSLDRRVLIEEGVRNPRELEVAIMGNHKLYPSPVGEITYDAEWNDYAAKYSSKKMPHYIIPANIPPDLAQKISSMALQIYRLLDCSGYGRIDFFMDPETEEIYFNEASCSPGFTASSIYPKLMGGAGYGLIELVEALVKFALERHPKREEESAASDASDEYGA